MRCLCGYQALFGIPAGLQLLRELSAKGRYTATKELAIYYARSGRDYGQAVRLCRQAIRDGYCRACAAALGSSNALTTLAVQAEDRGTWHRPPPMPGRRLKRG